MSFAKLINFSSFIGSLIMGIWADAPIIITPGMGVNAFFTYTLVVGMDLTWEQAVAISIISSLYMVIAFTPISDYLLKDTTKFEDRDNSWNWNVSSSFRIRKSWHC